MRIYTIYNATKQTFVKWGVNGGGAEGFCLRRGRPTFFTTPKQVADAVLSFDDQDNYEVRMFEEVRA